MDGVDGRHAEAGGKHPVVGRRGPAALGVAEDGGAGLDAGALLDHRGDHFADAAEARAVERVETLGRQRLLHAGELEALGDDEHRCTTSVAHMHDPLADLLDCLRLLGDQDGVGAAGHARVQGDPAHVAAHDLDDHTAAMGLGRGAQTVDGLGGDLDGGVEAERVVGGFEVVVDGLGNADDLESRIRQTACRGEGTLAADRDDRVDPLRIHRLLNINGAAVFALERVCAGTAEDGATLAGETAHTVPVQSHKVALDQAFPAVANADEFGIEDTNAFKDGTANDRVQPGAVSAAGEDTNFHLLLLLVAQVMRLAPTPPPINDGPQAGSVQIHAGEGRVLQLPIECQGQQVDQGAGLHRIGG